MVLFQWECHSHTFSSQFLFISAFCLDFTWMCNMNVIMRSRTSRVCVSEPFSLEKALHKCTGN